LNNPYECVLRLTSASVSVPERSRLLRDFAQDLGWRPSYQLTAQSSLAPLARAHLAVEHGLQPSAIITFLNQTTRADQLQFGDQNQLLGVSYNNLSDWHVCVEPDRVAFYNNRAQPSLVETRRIAPKETDALHAQTFYSVALSPPRPIYPSLETALIDTISSWKRNLAAEFETPIPMDRLSNLFNAILFVRALEDQTLGTASPPHATLLDLWTGRKGKRKLSTFLKRQISRLLNSRTQALPIDFGSLAAFDSLDPTTTAALLRSFYRHATVPYQFDFAQMSKHALSRIYEHYSSILRIPESNQTSFFPVLPNEEWNKAYGSIYTPEFIARFFARYLRQHLPPSTFRTLETIDPACGSGIFLRTLLELQTDQLQDGITTATIRDMFERVVGVDADPAAVHASQLSLTLLHLLLLGTPPRTLNILNAEAISHLATPGYQEKYGAVLVNPPFISIERLSSNLRAKLLDYMADYSTGRVDSYLAFLKLAVSLLKPGGYACFVLPHSFLLARNARKIRKLIADECWIRVLADLSAIKVFGETGSYVLLLIFEKKTRQLSDPPAPVILKCRDFVGHALEDVLEGRRAETPTYSIYETPQSDFLAEDWIILPPLEGRLRQRMHSLPRLHEFVQVRQGLVTGADDVFVVDSATIPKRESRVFKPFLPDRSMLRYTVPKSTQRSVFYPFLGDERLSEEDLKTRFPETWRRLELQKGRLTARRAVLRGECAWWAPERPRSPTELFLPKIVTPHLGLAPRFGLDVDGKFAVSHSTYLYAKEPSDSSDMLRFLVAVLNSPACYWYIAAHSHKYGRGYSMLEAKTLRSVPVPDPTRWPTETLRLITLVDDLLRINATQEIELEIESLVADMYEVTVPERKALGWI
jgi:hypothetical protein